MARLNVRFGYPQIRTHEGAPAMRINPVQQLRRSVLSCLLWEDEFYEDGQEIAKRIVALANQIDPKVVGELAIEARLIYNLRHVPLLLLSTIVKRTPLAQVIPQVIQRADELGEFLAIYAQVNKIQMNQIKKGLPKSLRRGLGRAFANFDAYQLAKYDREGSIRLRDVAFICHAKMPTIEGQVNLAKLVNKSYFPDKTKSAGFSVKEELDLGEFASLESPDTWEVSLSAGKDKKETFTRLIKDQKLGYLALLRNLRNMVQAGVDSDLIKEAVIARRGSRRVLPFRYVAAARACPSMEPAIDQALCEAVSESPVFTGKTVVLVDVSGSMDDKLSSKSDMTRLDAGAALACLFNGDRRVFTFSNSLVEVPPRFGMAGVDAIRSSQPHGGTELGGALQRLPLKGVDRLIVITDEQSHDRVTHPGVKRSYMINVASYQHGVGYGPWTHIDGFSESIFRFIREVEAAQDRKFEASVVAKANAEAAMRNHPGPRIGGEMG